MKEFIQILLISISCILGKIEASVLPINEISEESLQCLCEVYSGCEFRSDCILKEEQDVCGPYRLTRDYWTDAGLGLDSSELGSYIECTKNLECSERVIKRYISIHIKDCDDNGRIDWVDIGLVHFYGSSCESTSLRKSANWLSFRSCGRFLNPKDRWALPVTTSRTPTAGSDQASTHGNKIKFFFHLGAQPTAIPNFGPTLNNPFANWGAIPNAPNNSVFHYNPYGTNVGNGQQLLNNNNGGANRNGQPAYMQFGSRPNQSAFDFLGK